MGTIFLTIFLGLLCVFAVLFCLYLAIRGWDKLSAFLQARKQENVAAPEEEELDEETLIALLTAAVAAQAPDNRCKYRVVSFRRTAGDGRN